MIVVSTVCLSHRAQRLEVVGNSLIAVGFVPAVLSETGGAWGREMDGKNDELTHLEMKWQVQRSRGRKKSVKTILGEEGEGCERGHVLNE